MKSPTKKQQEEARATISVFRTDYRAFKRIAAANGRTMTGQFAFLVRLAQEQEARNGK